IESVILSPTAESTRIELADHLGELRRSAALRGLVHLEAALGETLGRLERESFGPAALADVRGLASRYGSLAALPSESGTHRVVRDGSGDVLRALVDRIEVELERGLGELGDDAEWLTSARPIIEELRSWIDQQPSGRIRFEDDRKAPKGRPSAPGPLGELEATLASGGEVYGDLETLGLSQLLQAAKRLRPDARIVLQDASSLFELVLQDGRVIDVMRTSIDGAVTEGAAAFSRLVGMTSGRFVVPQPPSSLPALDEGPVDETSEGPIEELNEPETKQDSPRVTDFAERENARAQSAVAMHHEPANEARAWTSPIWRLSTHARAENGDRVSRFELDVQTMPRVLGWAFWALLSATAGFLIWQQVTPVGAPAVPIPKEAPPVSATAEGAEREFSAPESLPATPPSGLDLSAFSGTLRAGVDPVLAVAEGQGVLEMNGPTEVSAEVDGVDWGALPVSAVLEEGIHAVRYRIGARVTYRFYYVKSGATRASRVAVGPGGLVDAR
ncbi:MAG: DUF4388 domain-containing protein, partial [Myxococcales bacterium]|nr:DUF4388 domain-containing protein [Myxococcales bacterium]